MSTPAAGHARASDDLLSPDAADYETKADRKFPVAVITVR
jgi:hypothetical protein